MFIFMLISEEISVMKSTYSVKSFISIFWFVFSLSVLQIERDRQNVRPPPSILFVFRFNVSCFYVARAPRQVAMSDPDDDVMATWVSCGACNVGQ